MNTMDTQHTNKAQNPTVLSPAESQMLQSSLLAMAAHGGGDAPSGPPALSSTPTLTGLLQALKRRWLVAVGLALLATTLLVFSVFTFMPPMYKAGIRFRVAARVPGSEDVEFSIFKANMESLVKSPLVINNALNDKTEDGREIKDLAIVKNQGMGVIDWLEKAIKTDYNLGPEVLRVTLAADDPKEAADLLGAISKAFLNEYAEMERSKKQQRLAELRVKRERNEEDLNILRKQYDNAMRNLAAKEREAINVQVATLTSRLAGADARRQRIEDELAKAESRIVTGKARLTIIDKLNIPDKVLYDFFLKSNELAPINKRIGDLQAQIDNLYASYTKEFADPIAASLVDQQKLVLKQKAAKEEKLKPELEVMWRKQVHEETTTQIEYAKEEIVELTAQREKVAKEMAKLENDIKRADGGEAPGVSAIKDKIEDARKALGATSQKISETELEVPGSRITLVTPPSVPNTKDRTQQTKIAGAGGLGVFIMALFGVAFLEFRARRITMPDEVAQGLGIKVVGTIPALPPRSKKSDPAAELAWQSQLQESVDAIRTVLAHQARSQALHVIMVTSASQGEGKTTLATQLAASLSRAWKRVLVIDADLRHSAVHKLFDVPQEPGLAEVLRGEVEASDAVKATALSRLWVLPAGNGDIHAIQALAQDNVRTLFEAFKQQYDFIIIDTPPVLPVTDTLLLGQHVDGVLFSVLQNVSRAPAIWAAQQKLAPLQVHSLGAVVLGAEAEFNDKTYGYGK